MKKRNPLRLSTNVIILLLFMVTASTLFVISWLDRRKELKLASALSMVDELNRSRIELDTNILKSRLSYLNHFDDIVRDQKRQAVWFQKLFDLMESSGHAETQSRLFQLRKIFATRDELIEEFKTSLSVYKNSAQYLGMVSSEMLALETLSPQFLKGYSQFHIQLAQFLDRPTPEQQERLLQELLMLEQKRLMLKDAEQLKWQQVFAHSQLLLKQALRIDQKVGTIISGELEQQLRQLNQSLSDQRQLIWRGLERYDLMLYIIIFGFSCYAFVILLRLKLVKDQLEVRVEERTHELGIATQKARDADAAKTAFLAHMSHEIRTPLNGVIGITGTLLKRQLPASDRDLVQAIAHCGNSLLALINDILDFSKIEARKLNLEYSIFNPVDVVSEALAVVSINAEKQNVRLSKELGPDLPQWIESDRNRLGQILLNLLSNAIKFSRNGQVTVQLEAQRIEDSSYELQLRVVDTGIGIEEGQLQNLFQEFSQADGSIASRFGGTGLGLAISKKLAELLGGRIEVQSQYGKGSTFCLIFPSRLIAHHIEEKPKDVVPDSRFSEKYPHSILVVDDNFINRKVAGDMLSGFGYAPDFAQDGQEALLCLQKKFYDLVFTDLRMPGMDGYQFVEEARRLLQDPPHFVAMTASATIEEREKCLKVGIRSFVTKPIRSEDVLAILAL